MIAYIEASPTTFHCVAESIRRLEAAGFVPWDAAAEPAPVHPGQRAYLDRAGTLIAWHAGSAAPAAAGFRLLGAHTDSPNLRLKPSAEYTSEGYVMWGTEPYGGLLSSTWADRDLGLAGRVAVRGDGGVETRLIRIDEPLARVSNLAIHLNRGVNDTGLILNKQTALSPMIALDDNVGGMLRDVVARAAGVEADALLNWDLSLFDLQPPRIGGLRREFVFSPRLDNQASCFNALSALMALNATPGHTSVVALFDHEEVGSTSERGADSTLLRNVLVQLERHHVVAAPGGFERAAANSYMVSADMAHGVHPNFADKHEDHHKPILGGGPVIKHNVNMRYSTDGQTAARFKAACQDEGVPMQEFVNRSDLTCGSTIGPVSASQLAVRSIDVGGAMLSMHSIREMCGSGDIDMMTRVMARILREG